MRPLTISLILIALISLAAACGGPSSPPDNNAPANNSRANINAPSQQVNNDPLATNRKPEVPTANNAPTIAPVVQAYYDALKKNDDTALMNILSTAYIRSVQADMKKEKAKGMAAFLAEYDTPTDKPIEVRNEKIDGDKAIADIRGGAYLNWTPFIFVKENGSWKFTGSSPDIDAVKQQK